MMNTDDLTTIILAVGAVLYLVIVGLALARRGLKERAARSLVLYAAVSFLWALTQALWRLGWLAHLPNLYAIHG
jgi:hypothetical protein